MAKNTGKRIYTGNHPTPEKGELAAIMPHCWAAYLTAFDRSSGWINFKLVATVPQPAKANFWLGLHVGESRWALTRDCQMLVRANPVAGDWVMKLAGLIDAGGVDGGDWREEVLADWAAGFASHPDWAVDELPAWDFREREEVVTAQKVGRVCAERVGSPLSPILIFEDEAHVLFGRKVRERFEAADPSGVLLGVDFPF